MKIITLTKGFETKVDDEDYMGLIKSRWRVIDTKSGLNYAGKGSQTILMHRVIMNAPVVMQVDHIDGDGLNNQRNNLRIVTQSQNLYNSKKKCHSASKYKGVYKRGERYKAECLGKYFGTFGTEIEAAKAYNKAAIEMMGEFARLNIIPGPEPLKIPSNSHKRPVDNGYEVLGYGRVLFWFADEISADEFIKQYVP